MSRSARNATHLLVALLCGILLAACSQVPKESVELSATVGRDLAVVHEAHRDLAKTLFRRMRADVNGFVDDVYAPYQIRAAMERQQILATSSDPAERNKSLLLAIRVAFSEDAPPGLQDEALQGMEVFVNHLRDDVESMRTELLEPLNKQEAAVLTSIDRSYQKLHHANSIVTGHLSSVVGVHETQASLLEAIGVERDLRAEVGEGLAVASEEIGSLVDRAEEAEDRLERAEDNANRIKEAVRQLGKRLHSAKDEG